VGRKRERERKRDGGGGGASTIIIRKRYGSVWLLAKEVITHARAPVGRETGGQKERDTRGGRWEGGGRRAWSQVKCRHARLNYPTIIIGKP